MEFFLEVRKDDVTSSENIKNFAYDVVLSRALDSKQIWNVSLNWEGRDIIEQYWTWTEIGDIFYNVKNDILTCTSYYPFGWNSEEDTRARLLWKWIAKEIEKIIVKDLLNFIRIDTIYELFGPYTNNTRKEQLRKMWFEINKEYTLGSFAEILVTDT